GVGKVELTRLGQDGVFQVGFGLGRDAGAGPAAGGVDFRVGVGRVGRAAGTQHLFGDADVQGVGAKPAIKNEDRRLEALVRGLGIDVPAVVDDAAPGIG